MFASLQETLAALFQDPTERLIVMGALLLSGIAVLTYFALRFRRRAVGRLSSSSDHLSEFREMYESGKMREFEFRRVRSQLGQTVQREVLGDLEATKENGNRGRSRAAGLPNFREVEEGEKAVDAATLDSADQSLTSSKVPWATEGERESSEPGKIGDAKSLAGQESSDESPPLGDRD